MNPNKQDPYLFSLPVHNPERRKLSERVKPGATIEQLNRAANKFLTLHVEYFERERYAKIMAAFDAPREKHKQYLGRLEALPTSLKRRNIDPGAQRRYPGQQDATTTKHYQRAFYDLNCYKE